jgi:hypothetical protein
MQDEAVMNRIYESIAAHSDWLLAFVPLFCMLVYFATQSRWDAYSRRKAYEELKLLNDLREKRILTQEEFDEKKEELLCL